MKKTLSILLAAVLLFGLAGCGSKNEEAAVTMDLQQVYAGFGETLPEMTMMSDEMMLNFCGINRADCKQAVVSVSSDGLRADEIWLLEAKDGETAENLAKLANTRIERKGEESITYSPEQYEIVQKAEIIQSGNYVALIVSPDVDTLAAQFRTAAGLGG